MNALELTSSITALANAIACQGSKPMVRLTL